MKSVNYGCTDAIWSTAPGVALTWPWGYIHVHYHSSQTSLLVYISGFQVSVYRTIGPLVTIMVKNKNGNKGNILYLLHLTSRKNHFKTISSKQQWWLWDRKHLIAALFIMKICHFAHLLSAIPQATCILIRRIQFCSLNAY